MKILGISAFYHDSAAALIEDGNITAAAQEERFTRIKHDPGFPEQAISWCLKSRGLKHSDINYVVFYEKPFLKFERILESYMQYAPKGVASFIKAMPVWIKRKLWIKDILATKLEGFKGEFLFPEHHQSHAASAFFPSPFKEAAFLTTDGVGEWATTSYGSACESSINIMGEIHFPHSLGLLYSAFTYYTGFKVNSGEYKVMGLAPYGNPKYVNVILDHLIDLKEDGSFRLNMDYFDYPAGLKMTSQKFHKLFGGPPSARGVKPSQRDMDLARSVQEVIELAVLKITRHIKKETAQENLCLAGGVALNCVANGKLLKEGLYKNIWIQPASGDAGGALGAAYFGWHHYLRNERVPMAPDAQRGSYLGPVYSKNNIKEYLDENSIPYKEMFASEIAKETARLVAAQNVVGWHQGPMEFGPRALGARSIIGDARSPKMQEFMNLKIKFRESFRPFAPSVLAEHVSEYFDIKSSSPYMLLVADVRKDRLKQISDEDSKKSGLDLLKIVRSEIPAVTHVDGTARLQTVHRETNPLYHEMITAFHALTGCPLIINTSFNVRGEPIVESPEDAYKCFMRTNMDFLVMGNFILDKKAQPVTSDNRKWLKEFELD
jgi:carbamoyltransferase